MEVIKRNELRRNLGYHVVTANVEVEACGVEVKHPTKAGAIGGVAIVYSSREPFDGSHVDISANMVKSIAYE